MASLHMQMRPTVVIAGLLICAGMILFRAQIRSVVHPVAAEVPMTKPKSYTVDERFQQYGESVRTRLTPYFQKAGVSYPPAALTFIGLKQERTLEVYASGNDRKRQYIRSYPVLAASGHAGPKLREGDLQVPEGLYRIESLNPNSLFHLSLRVNYPNEFDKAQAAKEHRENLGADIMIHGNAISVGCMAMGDETAEDLFVMAAITGVENIQVILSPVDFRVQEMQMFDSPVWMVNLYEQISAELKKYPVITRTNR